VKYKVEKEAIIVQAEDDIEDAFCRNTLKLPYHKVKNVNTELMEDVDRFYAVKDMGVGAMVAIALIAGIFFGMLLKHYVF